MKIYYISLLFLFFSSNIWSADVDLRAANIIGKGPISDKDAALMCTTARKADARTVTKHGINTLITTKEYVITNLHWYPSVNSETVSPGIRLPCKNCDLYPIKINGYIKNTIVSPANQFATEMRNENRVPFSRVGYVGKDSSYDEWYCSTKMEGKA